MDFNFFLKKERIRAVKVEDLGDQIKKKELTSFSTSMPNVFGFFFLRTIQLIYTL